MTHCHSLDLPLDRSMCNFSISIILMLFLFGTEQELQPE